MAEAIPTEPEPLYLLQLNAALPAKTAVASPTEPLYLSYLDGQVAAGASESTGMSTAFHFNSYYQTSDGKSVGPVQVLMDTGSKWLNIGSDNLPEDCNCYTVIDPQPDWLEIPSYSSSENTYEGSWVYVTVTLEGGNGNTFTTDQIVAFRATNHPSVAMMGVTTRFPSYQYINTFLNVPQIVSGTWPAGYILNNTGVTFGYSQQDAAQFQMIELQSVAQGQVMPVVSFSMTGSLGSYEGPASLLMDSGIQYALLQASSSSSPPDNKLWTSCSEQANNNGGAVNFCTIKDDVTVSLSLAAGLSWTFSTSNCGSAYPEAPQDARLDAATPGGYFNTGIHFLENYQYLIEMDSSNNSKSGHMGFLAYQDTAN